ncbi:methyltransferase domain-containing protein [bacterium]|nr:methyltransferase domain-containing protein [bacterium]
MIHSPLYELDIPEGLADVVQSDLLERCAGTVDPQRIVAGSSFIRLNCPDVRCILTLPTVNAVYQVLSYNIPRPKALLGHEHWTRLLIAVEAVSSSSSGTFHSFHINAAGSDSSVMQRIRTTFAQDTGLHYAPDEGDMLLRIRPGESGWEVLIRMTPRPLSTRNWRICNYEGALNGPVARSMVMLSSPGKDDYVLNVGCGSGSLLIERLLHTESQRVVGIDINNTAIDCASQNLASADRTRDAVLLTGDARRLPFKDASFTHLYADLPFGQLVGSHQTNQQLYPHLLREAARVAGVNALFTLITHEVRLMDTVLKAQMAWQVDHRRMVTYVDYIRAFISCAVCKASPSPDSQAVLHCRL